MADVITWGSWINRWYNQFVIKETWLEVQKIAWIQWKKIIETMNEINPKNNQKNIDESRSKTSDERSSKEDGIRQAPIE